jgi:hypothetical protein
MKTYGEAKIWLHGYLTSGGQICFIPRQSPGYPLDRRPGRSQSRSHSVDVKTLLPPPPPNLSSSPDFSVFLSVASR